VVNIRRTSHVAVRARFGDAETAVTVGELCHRDRGRPRNRIMSSLICRLSGSDPDRLRTRHLSDIAGDTAKFLAAVEAYAPGQAARFARPSTN
jgi:hypothetical protein